MADIQGDLMYLTARFPSLTLFLEDVDEKDVGPLVEKINGIIEGFVSDGNLSGDALERAEDLQEHWDIIKAKIKPHAKIDTSALVEDVKQIGNALLSSSTSSSETISVGSDDESSSMGSSISSDTEPSAEEQVIDIQTARRYREIESGKPKLIKAFRHVLTQAKKGVYGKKVQELLDESAPEMTELRPLLRAMLLEIIDNPELTPEFVKDLKDLDELKALLPDDEHLEFSLKEAAILAELPKEYEALEKELNRLTALYGSVDEGQLEKDFKVISRLLFPEVLSEVGSIRGDQIIMRPGAHDVEEINSWLLSIPNPEAIKKIRIINAGLTQYPEALSRFINVESLNLSGNQLKSLPDSIGALTQLKTLYLSNNQIEHLPDKIGDLTQLVELSVLSNRLSSLPDSIRRLTQLEFLNLSQNQLESLPDWIGELTQLIDFFLSGNRLEVLPDSVERLVQLGSFDLSGNRLKVLPDVIGRLSQLTILNLAGNELKSLPDSMSNLNQLTDLDLSNNQLTDFPDGVERLLRIGTFDVSGNPDLEVPVDLDHFADLTEPMDERPESLEAPGIINRITSWIRNWFQGQ